MRQLVRDAQRGDIVALSAVLDHLSERLRRVCGSVALGRGDDALQETLLLVMRHLPDLREPDALDGWARRIAIRESLRAATGRSDVPVDDLPEVAATDIDHDLRVDSRAVLEQLKPAHRAVLVLRYLEGLSEEEVADVLSLSTGTVKSRTARAKRAFASRWAR